MILCFSISIFCFFSSKTKWWRGMGSNHRPSDYEPDELPLLYPATSMTQYRNIFFVKEKWLLEELFFALMKKVG